MKSISQWYGARGTTGAPGITAAAMNDTSPRALPFTEDLTLAVMESLALEQQAQAISLLSARLQQSAENMKQQLEVRQQQFFNALQAQLEEQVLQVLGHVLEKQALHGGMQIFADAVKAACEASRQSATVMVNEALKSAAEIALAGAGLPHQHSASPGAYADVEGARIELALEPWKKEVMALVCNGK